MPTTNSGPDQAQPDQALLRLDGVVARLIGPDGCSWDKEQTPATLVEYLIEECFELADALRSGQTADVREELGDLLFLLVFVSRLYANQGAFTLAEALDSVNAKMVRRHPHVFNGARLDDRQALLDNWERIKREEKAAGPARPASVFAGLPRNLPPLTKAYRIHAKAAGVGFTWPEDEEVERQVEAEWLELLDAQAQADSAALERELGDHLFSLVEFGRRKGIKAAAALDAAANRFLDRFARMEALACERGLDFKSLSLDDKDELWEAVKAAVD